MPSSKHGFVIRVTFDDVLSVLAFTTSEPRLDTPALLVLAIHQCHDYACSDSYVHRHKSLSGGLATIKQSQHWVCHELADG